MQNVHYLLRLSKKLEKITPLLFSVSPSFWSKKLNSGRIQQPINVDSVLSGNIPLATLLGQNVGGWQRNTGIRLDFAVAFEGIWMIENRVRQILIYDWNYMG